MFSTHYLSKKNLYSCPQNPIQLKNMYFKGIQVIA